MIPQTRRPFAIVGAATATVVALIATVGPASAGRHYRGQSEASVVVAESRFGNGTISGPVRLTRLGRQVRLPGGTWEYCRRSCSETLRVNTVDFWESKSGGGSGSLTNECGIFGCLELRYPR